MLNTYEIQGVSYLNAGEYLGTCSSLEEAKGWAEYKASMYPEFEALKVFDVAGAVVATYKTKG